MANSTKNSHSPSISISADSQSQHAAPKSQGRVQRGDWASIRKDVGICAILPREQILERIAAVDAGRTLGREGSAQVPVNSNNLISKGFWPLPLVLLLHSVPEYVAGDWLVDPDGSTIDLRILWARQIHFSGIDSYFDYQA